MKLSNSLSLLVIALAAVTAFLAIPLSAQAQVIRVGDRCFDVLGRRVTCPPGLPPLRPPIPPGTSRPPSAGGSFGAPEPETFLVVGSGLVGVAAWCRKREKARSHQSPGL